MRYGVGVSRAGSPSTVLSEEPTPKPPSAVVKSDFADAERRAALAAYFADLPPEARALDEAWEEALALCGDEGSDAWLAALEAGTHPLCRVQLSPRPA
jgi:hypothetical protein